MTRRVLLAGTILALTASAGVSGAQGTNVEYTYSPQQGPRGTTVTISGTCSPDIQAEVAVWSAWHKVSGGEQPYQFRRDLDVDDTTGKFSGTIVVPQDAPLDNYGVSLYCRESDQLFPGPDGTFIVTQQAATTTTLAPTTTTLVLTTTSARAAATTTTTTTTTPTTTTTTSTTGPPATTKPVTTTADGSELAGDTPVIDDGAGGGPSWLAISLGLLAAGGAGSFAWARHRRAQS